MAGNFWMNTSASTSIRLGKSKIYIISSSVFSNDINKARSYPLVKDFISKPLNVEKIKELFGVVKLNRSNGKLFVLVVNPAYCCGPCMVK
jgi:hypothetical protein